MDIENLTLKQLKEIAAMFPQHSATVTYGTQKQGTHPMVGQYCIARCYAAGVHAGLVVHVDGENVILSDSRRLWSWKAQDGVALSGVAQHGVKKNESKIDVINPQIYLTGVCELIPATAKAKESIHGKE